MTDSYTQIWYRLWHDHKNSIAEQTASSLGGTRTSHDPFQHSGELPGKGISLLLGRRRQENALLLRLEDDNTLTFMQTSTVGQQGWASVSQTSARNMCSSAAITERPRGRLRAGHFQIGACG
jgi:hypothetical protein